VRWTIIACLVAVPVFIVLALWNGAVAVLFAVGVLTWLLAGMYRRSVGGDVFGENDEAC
jgi:hypothetical protein